MNPLKPLPKSPTRSFNRGDSFSVQGAASFEPGLKPRKKDEAYFSLDDISENHRAHHDVLVKHGYKYKEGWRSSMGGPHKVHYYQHPNGARAAHYEAHGKTMTGTASNMKEHSTAKDLDHTLSQIHGPAKHSDERGEGARFVDRGLSNYIHAKLNKDRADAHASLRKHGYRKVYDHSGETSWRHRDGHEVDHSDEGWHYNHAVKGRHKEGKGAASLDKHLQKVHRIGQVPF